jgi:hypothetical protein
MTHPARVVPELAPLRAPAPRRGEETLTAQIIHFPIERVPESQARPTVEESRAYLDKLLEELKAAQSERKELERRIRSLSMRARHAVERLKRERLTKSR